MFVQAGVIFQPWQIHERYKKRTDFIAPCPMRGGDTKRNLTLQDAQAVKTLQDGVGELHILGEREGSIVPTTDRIGSRHHRTPVIAIGWRVLSTSGFKIVDRRCFDKRVPKQRTVPYKITPNPNPYHRRPRMLRLNHANQAMETELYDATENKSRASNQTNMHWARHRRGVSKPSTKAQPNKLIPLGPLSRGVRDVRDSDQNI